MRRMTMATLPFIASEILHSQTIPSEQHKIVEGYNWRYSQELKVNALVPFGWVYQDLSFDSKKGQELFITPLGVPPFTPGYRFGLFGGIRIRKISIPPKLDGAINLRNYLDARKKMAQQELTSKSFWYQKKRRFVVGSFEFFQFETHFPNGNQEHTISVLVFNESIPSGYEITALIPNENHDSHELIINRIINLLQFSPTGI